MSVCPKTISNNVRQGSQCTYVDRPEAGTVAGSHVLVKTLDRICTAEITELLVHIVGSRARIIAQPDTKVLHFQRLLLVNLKRHVETTAISAPIPPAT